MDRGKRPGSLARNHMMYMDLKDIIRENALQFLPAKSLLRFRAVCRDWKFQISTPFFVHKQSIFCGAVLGYFTQEPGQPPSLICMDSSSCGVADPSLLFLPEPVDIRSSSNGLVLCQGRAGDRAYYVCNPMTQQWKKLPKPIVDHGRTPAAVLVYEPSLLSFEADYKIICAFASNDFDDATEFDIYSSKEGSWKISGEISFANLKIDPKSGFYANGVVCWKGRSLILFDLSKERTQLINNVNIGVTLGTMYGKICSAFANGCSVSLSLLQNSSAKQLYLTSWKEKERVIFGREKFAGTLLNQDVIAIRDNYLLIKSGGELYYYDIQTKEAKALGAASKHSNAIYLPYVNNFTCL